MIWVVDRVLDRLHDFIAPVCRTNVYRRSFQARLDKSGCVIKGHITESTMVVFTQ